MGSLAVRAGASSAGLSTLQGGNAFVEPRPEVDMLPAAEIADPIARGKLALKARRFDEVDRVDAFPAQGAVLFVLRVEFPFAAAPLAREIAGREAGEQQVRVAQRRFDAQFPVLRHSNFIPVEENRQVLRRELAVRALQLRYESRDPPRLTRHGRLIVLAGVTYEQVIAERHRLSPLDKTGDRTLARCSNRQSQKSDDIVFPDGARSHRNRALRSNRTSGLILR